MIMKKSFRNGLSTSMPNFSYLNDDLEGTFGRRHHEISHDQQNVTKIRLFDRDGPRQRSFHHPTAATARRPLNYDSKFQSEKRFAQGLLDGNDISKF